MRRCRIQLERFRGAYLYENVKQITMPIIATSAAATVVYTGFLPLPSIESNAVDVAQAEKSRRKRLALSMFSFRFLILILGNISFGLNTA